MKEWTTEDSKRLASLKYVTDNDNIRIKEIIKQKLLANDAEYMAAQMIG